MPICQVSRGHPARRSAKLSCCHGRPAPPPAPVHPSHAPLQAWARPGSLIFDPYCGTGSLLIAAARLGSYVIGGDIDMRVLKLGKRNQKTGDPEDNFSNFAQYGLPWPAGLLRMDASRPPWRAGLREVRGGEVGGGWGGSRGSAGAAVM